MKEMEKRRSDGTPLTEVRVPCKAIITDIFSVLVTYNLLAFGLDQRVWNSRFRLC